MKSHTHKTILTHFRFFEVDGLHKDKVMPVDLSILHWRGSDTHRLYPQHHTTIKRYNYFSSSLQCYHTRPLHSQPSQLLRIQKPQTQTLDSKHRLTSLFLLLLLELPPLPLLVALPVHSVLGSVQDLTEAIEEHR